MILDDNAKSYAKEEVMETIPTPDASKSTFQSIPVNASSLRNIKLAKYLMKRPLKAWRSP